MDNKQEKIARAAWLLEQEFGPEWKTIAASLGIQDLTRRVGKELTSFVGYPERGEGGDSRWRGNCAPEIVEAVVRYVLDSKLYYGKDISQFTLLDPMSGSGTSGYVAQKLGIKHQLYDLNPTPNYGRGNWNALKDEVATSADLIFWHPPYHDIIKYSGSIWGKPHLDDLSRCQDYEEFLDKMNLCIRKFYTALRNDGRLAILVGDVRQNGKFYSMQKDIMRMGEFESFIVKGQYNCVSDNRRYKKPFIPVVTEYMLVYHKENPVIIPFTWTRKSELDIRKTDYIGVTWHHLIRSTMESLGGESKLSDLGRILSEHPKAKRNPHYKERIRATCYEHPEDFVPLGNGYYRLSYNVA